jgi:predicted oxidoreductase
MRMGEDLTFSRIVLGFWRLLDWGLSTEALADYIAACQDIGITTMDHADIYGNYMVEEKFGDAIRYRPSLKRNMEVITKCGIIYPSETARVKYYDYSEAHIIHQAERSIKLLGVDHIDTLLLHRPSPMMDPGSVASAFEKLYKAGKVKSFGVSNFLPSQFRMLKSYLTVPLVTNQVELSALRMENLENGVMDLAIEERIHPLIWSPLGGGKIFTSDAPEAVRLREVLGVIREEVGAEDIDEIAFAWLLSHPAGLIPITGSGEIKLASRPVGALKYRLTEEQWFMIWTAVKGHKVL